ncbi:MAG: SDR family oxidoreductase, partial [Lachnospiraceae bacterium]|nr:SDR family oxidoreductase [Lachnospiraceae bacterium]
TDGSGLEVVCDEKILRFFPIGNVFYCLVRGKSGADRVFSCTEDGETQILYEGDCRWISTDDFGIDVLFVEDMRTFKEYHFLISYEELKDFLKETENH